jgi:hypothetical protein
MMLGGTRAGMSSLSSSNSIIGTYATRPVRRPSFLPGSHSRSLLFASCFSRAAKAGSSFIFTPSGDRCGESRRSSRLQGEAKIEWRRPGTPPLRKSVAVPRWHIPSSLSDIPREPCLNLWIYFKPHKSSLWLMFAIYRAHAPTRNLTEKHWPTTWLRFKLGTPTWLRLADCETGPQESIFRPTSSGTT